MNKGFTLAEIIIIILIIGILASLALPSYTKGKERALGKEAQANLIIISGAERNYKMETGNYYGSTHVSDINENLLLSLVDVETNPNSQWDYNISIGGGGFNATAARNPLMVESKHDCTYFLNSTVNPDTVFALDPDKCP